MIHSMTAFARQSAQGGKGILTIELRSVNHRYSEVSMRLPEDLRFLEPKAREQIAVFIKRGKVDCMLRYQAPDMQESGVQIDRALLGVLTTAAREVEAMLQQATPMKAMDLLRWPGVLKTPEQDMTEVGKRVMELLDAALKELVETRRREGEQLKQVIEIRCDAMDEEVRRIQARLPEVLSAMRSRLAARLEELKTQVDADRLEQEMAILASKADIAEEIDRLQTHIKEVRRVLNQDQPVGRRLDFLMQELNREANTIGSKSADSETTQGSVELKVLIEQMREQVQNIE